ncbi:MAG: DUF664 domain-containing protein [Dermatophilaceae bacterium]
MRPAVIDDVNVFLRFHGALREQVLTAVAGLDDEAMTRAVLPSGWSCAQLIHHLAVDVERMWYRAAIAGEHEAVDSLSHNGWNLPIGLTATDVLDLYIAESNRSKHVLTNAELDAPPAWWPTDFPADYRLNSTREVVMHAFIETAVHVGHLDAVRELIDGRQRIVLT